MEEEMKIEEMKMEMKKKYFEFSRDKIAKSDEKVSVKLPKLKIQGGGFLSVSRFFKEMDRGTQKLLERLQKEKFVHKSSHKPGHKSSECELVSGTLRTQGDPFKNKIVL